MTAWIRAHWVWALPLMGVAALAVAPGDDGPTICPFALCTGTACPGCGLTRAAASLVRGDVTSAFAYHPLVLVAGGWVVGAWAMAVVRRSGRQIRLDTAVVNRLLYATAALFLITWIVRYLTGSLPAV